MDGFGVGGFDDGEMDWEWMDGFGDDWMDL